ncbi:twin-arginine translocation signal domain-containing protein, partial [Streptomyces scabiei]
MMVTYVNGWPMTPTRRNVLGAALGGAAAATAGLPAP